MNTPHRTESNEISDQKIVIVIDLLYGPITFAAKLSLFLLYYRLFSQYRWMRNLIYIGMGVIAANYFATVIVFGYLCIPRRGHGWIETFLHPRCQKQFIVISYFRGPFNVLSDVYLLLLPLPAVWHLNMPLRKRIGIAGIFLTGSL